MELGLTKSHILKEHLQFIKHKQKQLIQQETKQKEKETLKLSFMEKMEKLKILIHTIERMTQKNLKVDKVNLFTLYLLLIEIYKKVIKSLS